MHQGRSRDGQLGKGRQTLPFGLIGTCVLQGDSAKHQQACYWNQDQQKELQVQGHLLYQSHASPLLGTALNNGYSISYRNSRVCLNICEMGSEELENASKKQNTLRCAFQTKHAKRLKK